MTLDQAVKQVIKTNNPEIIHKRKKYKLYVCEPSEADSDRCNKQEVAVAKAKIEATAKVQEEADNSRFKQNARFKSIETAERLNPNRSFTIEKGKNPVAYDVVKEAEKIYQWLVKVIK